MTPQQITELIKSIPLFKDIDDRDIVQLQKLASPKTLTEGDFMIVERQLTQGIYLLLSGHVEVYISLPGSAEFQRIATLGKGDVIGELSLLGMTRRSASVKTASAVDVISWRNEDLLGYFATKKDVGYTFMTNLARILAGRIVRIDKDLANALYQSHQKF